jgi:hypothetical protein
MANSPSKAIKRYQVPAMAGEPYKYGSPVMIALPVPPAAL